MSYEAKNKEIQQHSPSLLCKNSEAKSTRQSTVTLGPLCLSDVNHIRFKQHN